MLLHFASVTIVLVYLHPQQCERLPTLKQGYEKGKGLAINASEGTSNVDHKDLLLHFAAALCSSNTTWFCS